MRKSLKRKKDASFQSSGHYNKSVEIDFPEKKGSVHNDCLDSNKGMIEGGSLLISRVLCGGSEQ